MHLEPSTRHLTSSRQESGPEHNGPAASSSAPDCGLEPAAQGAWLCSAKSQCASARTLAPLGLSSRPVAWRPDPETVSGIGSAGLGRAGQLYYRRKLAEGKSPKEALRCLKRRLSDAVYRCLLVDQQRWVALAHSVTDNPDVAPDRPASRAAERGPTTRAVPPRSQTTAAVRATGSPACPVSHPGARRFHHRWCA
jgi:hypothetical protein